MQDQRPYRPTCRVLILKDDLICLGHVMDSKTNKLRCYNFPGGGVDEGHRLAETVEKEALEEVGLRIKNIRPLGVSLKERHSFRDPERAKRFCGSDTHYFQAEFVKLDDRLLGSEGDALAYTWETIPHAASMIRNGPADHFNDIRLQALGALKLHTHRAVAPSFMTW